MPERGSGDPAQPVSLRATRAKPSPSSLPFLLSAAQKGGGKGGRPGSRCLQSRDGTRSRGSVSRSSARSCSSVALDVCGECACSAIVGRLHPEGCWHRGGRFSCMGVGGFRSEPRRLEVVFFRFICGETGRSAIHRKDGEDDHRGPAGF